LSSLALGNGPTTPVDASCSQPVQVTPARWFSIFPRPDARVSRSFGKSISVISISRFITQLPANISVSATST